MNEEKATGEKLPKKDRKMPDQNNPSAPDGRRMGLRPKRAHVDT